MDSTEDRISIMNMLVKIIFIEAQIQGNSLQQSFSGLFKLPICFLKRGVEFRYITNLNIIGIFLFHRIIIIYFLSVLKKFFQIRCVASFSMFLTERSVPA